MKLVIQRSKEASVEVDGKIVGAIPFGLVILVGFTQNDTETDIDYLIDKTLNLRIFDDEHGVMNRSLLDVGGYILSISQFTLYADCKKGNRPSFIRSGSPEMAKKLYNYILEKCREQFPNTQQGEFGANMQVSLTNDGPFTILLDSNEIERS